MLIYEMFITGVGQAGSGPKEDVTEILSPWEEEGKRGMQGTYVEQVQQVARLKRLINGKRKEPPPYSTAPSALKTPSHGLECKSKTKPPGRSRLQPLSQPCSNRARSCLCG